MKIYPPSTLNSPCINITTQTTHTPNSAASRSTSRYLGLFPSDSPVFQPCTLPHTPHPVRSARGSKGVTLDRLIPNLNAGCPTWILSDPILLLSDEPLSPSPFPSSRLLVPKLARSTVKGLCKVFNPRKGMHPEAWRSRSTFLPSRILQGTDLNCRSRIPGIKPPSCQDINRSWYEPEDSDTFLVKYELDLPSLGLGYDVEALDFSITTGLLSLNLIPHFKQFPPYIRGSVPTLKEFCGPLDPRLASHSSNWGMVDPIPTSVLEHLTSRSEANPPPNWDWDWLPKTHLSVRHDALSFLR